MSSTPPPSPQEEPTLRAPAQETAPPTRFLEPGDGRRIAYVATDAPTDSLASAVDPDKERCGILFCGGFRSDMTGTKAVHLESWAKSTGRAFVRFDYTGHGRSSGAFEALGVGDWAQDAADILLSVAQGPQILVGSSMGGWIALLLAKRYPDRVAGLVGVAAAPDFTEDSMWAGFTDAQRAEIEAVGRIDIPSEYSDDPYPITRRLIENGRENLVLREPLAIGAPVRLLHGTADADVADAVSLRLLEHLDCPDARLTLVKDGDHRLSAPRELGLLTDTVEEVIAARAAETGRDAR